MDENIIPYWSIIAEAAQKVQEIATSVSNSNSVPLDDIEEMNDIVGMIAELILMGSVNMDRAMAKVHIANISNTDGNMGYFKLLKKALSL